MSDPRVSLITVLYNSSDQVEGWAETVLSLSLPPDEILVVDNASQDRGTETVKRHFPAAQIVRNENNLGFGAACNQALSLARGEYVFLLNPDARLEGDYLEILVGLLRENSQCGAVSGKLFKGDGRIDSAGQILQRNRQVHNRGAGQTDRDLYQEEEAVFGVPGAAALYRRQALDQIALDGEVFDPIFFLYYEDSDLSWRLRLAGWECWYTHRASGIHPSEGALDSWRKIHLRCNRLLMMVKNEEISDFAKDLHPILRYEATCVKNGFFRERWAFRAYARFFKHLPQALKRRRRTRSMKSVRIRPWISPVVSY